MPQPEAAGSGWEESTGMARAGRREVEVGAVGALMALAALVTDDMDIGGVEIPGVEGGVKDGLRREDGGGCCCAIAASS